MQDKDFFLKPESSTQKQYEAIRSIIVDGISPKDAASKFNYSLFT